MQVGSRIEEFTYSYVPAYGDLARANIRSLERGLSIRRIVIDKLQSPDDSSQHAALRDRYDSLGGQVELEILAARALIRGLIAKGPALGEVSTLSQFESRIDAINEDTRRRLDAETKRLLAALDSGDKKALDEEMERVDELRDELNKKLDSIRADMLALLRRDANMTVEKQQQVMLISIVLTVLAAILGLVFAALVSTGVTRPVRRLLEGARAVEAGNLHGTLVATSRDEIGHLTTAFNQMVEQLRLKERLRETFGKYVDPRVVAGLIEGPALAAEGERRVMTVLFCDVKGFTGTSEGMTPQGLVKVMNRYFSTMSAPIRAPSGRHRQIHRRRHHGLLGTALRRRRRAGAAGQPGGAGDAAAGAAIARRVSRIARRPHAAEHLRHPHRHCHRRSAGRQHRFRTDDELHRDGRYREPGVAAGGRQQGVWRPHPGVRGDDRRRLPTPSRRAKSTGS